jgi:N-acetylglucosaminyldiphosphoundecaprenol N-acetyl-beta-D-mannosaminyltransferase
MGNEQSTPKKKEIGHMWVLGVKLHQLTPQDLVDKFVEYGQEENREHPKQILPINVQAMNLQYWDPEYRRILKAGDTIYADGIGVILGARICGKYLRKRLTAADFIYDVCAAYGKHRLTAYFFGNKPGVAENSARVLEKMYPGFKVVGTRDGYYKEADSPKIIEQINATKPNMLLVGTGTPKQEKWIDRHLKLFRVPCLWPVGATLDYVVGEEKRAPKMFEKAEWLFRLLQNFGHKWRRYIIGNPAYLCRLARYYVLMREHEEELKKRRAGEAQGSR